MVLGYGVSSYAWWCFGMPLLGQQIPIFIDAEAFRQNPHLLLKSFLILVTFIGSDVTSHVLRVFSPASSTIKVKIFFLYFLQP